MQVPACAGCSLLYWYDVTCLINLPYQPALWEGWAELRALTLHVRTVPGADFMLVGITQGGQLDGDAHMCSSLMPIAVCPAVRCHWHTQSATPRHFQQQW